jgi:RNA polymerase sigma factor (sigma-70 family)
VLQARGKQIDSARMALSELCEAYWLPLYAFIRHRSGNAHDAQDLTQDFFTQLLSKDYLNDVDPDRGRFRSFLLASAKHFLSNERDRAATIKRGGRVVIESLDWRRGESCFQDEPADTMTAERLFERQWAVALLDRVLDRLREEQVTSGKSRTFEALSGFLSTDRAAIDYVAAATGLEMTVDAVRVATHRLRKRYRQLLRDEIAQTTATANEVDDELKCLFTALQ